MMRTKMTESEVLRRFKMAAKKKTTKRKCSKCGKRGHNKRSHKRGGKFA
jgi:hypothetical protein